MGRYEDYLEMHGNDRYDDEDKENIRSCAVCGVDGVKLYDFDGECLCEQCLLEKYYHGDAIDFPTEICCDRCGEPIDNEVYCVQGKDGECEFYDEECLLNMIDD